MILEFVKENFYQILSTLITAVIGYVGFAIKSLYKKHVNSKLIKEICKISVTGVEQIYKDLHGEDKLNKAVEAASEMLSAKGISCTSFELRMLIESAVKEMNLNSLFVEDVSDVVIDGICFQDTLNDDVCKED